MKNLTTAEALALLKEIEAYKAARDKRETSLVTAMHAHLGIIGLGARLDAFLPSFREHVANRLLSEAIKSNVEPDSRP